MVKLCNLLYVIIFVILVVTNLETIAVAASVHFPSIKDPRTNSSYYDLRVGENRPYGSVIGNAGDVLLEKRLILSKSDIVKYKLIYYSPQFVPSSLLLSKTTPTLMEKQKPATIIEADEEPVFSVNERNGSISINTPNEPILEYLCLKKAYCSCLACIFSLNIIYTSEQRISAETIRVFIDDVNDYAPEFYHRSGEFNVNVSEASQIGELFRLVNAAAFDLDAYYNRLVYYINDGGDALSETRSGLFEISSVLGKDLMLILKSHLDYEIKSRYELYLIVRDNGGLKAAKRLVINVIDENDNSPVCEKSLFIESIRENRLESDFMQIRASDLDSAINARLHFSILDNLDLNELFSIDKSTGWLSVRKELDYETKTFYEFVVKIEDVGVRNNFTTYCSARVNLIDVNDNPAQMKIIKYLNESVMASFYSLNSMSDIAPRALGNGPIMDNSGGPTAAAVSFVDMSYGSFFKNQIEILENNEENLVLALLRVFDSDSISNYKFSIQSATNSHEDTSMFEIRYSDRANREFELIATKAFNSELIQNYRLKIVLYDLDLASEATAADREYDELLNGRFGSGMNSKPAELDNELMVNKLINGKPYHMAGTFRNTFQHVKVLDVNDNEPEFIKKYYEFYLEENTFNVSLNVPPIEVYDLDTSEVNSRLKYRLIDKHHHNLTHPISDYIQISESTENNYPLLFLSKPFDYELDGDKIEFELAAFDVDNFTDTCTISIYIKDLNDNRPLFMNENTTFSIRENSPSNSFIGQVIVIDKDSAGPNSDVSFRIASENLKSLFKIYKTGVVSNWAPFDRETRSHYVLTIEAFNTAMPSLTRKASYFIRIEDENDNRPRFVYPKENTTYLSVQFAGIVRLPNTTNLLRLFDVKAIDDDLDENGRLSYFIDDSTGRSFLIDKANGSVYFNFFAWNITSLSQLATFKRIFNVFMRVCDSAPKKPLCSWLNFTLYLNYDTHELDTLLPPAKRVSNDAIRSDRLADETNSALTLSNSGDQTFKKNFFQLVSNSVLIIILLTVLMFMVFIACFLFIIFYKKSSCDQSKPTPSSKKPNASYHVSNSDTTKQAVVTYDKSPSSTSLGQCWDTIASRFKKKCNLVKASSFNNIAVNSAIEENLTVKDASPDDNENFEKMVTPIIGNSFKVTIKNTEQKTKFVFDNFNTRLNSDNSLVIEKLSKMPSLESSSSDSENTYSNELCINDFSKNNFHKRSGAGLLVNDDSTNYKKHSLTSDINSNNSTIIINSINTSSSPSSSISNSPDKLEFNSPPISRQNCPQNDIGIFPMRNNNKLHEQGKFAINETYYKQSYKLKPPRHNDFQSNINLNSSAITTAVENKAFLNSNQSQWVSANNKSNQNLNENAMFINQTNLNSSEDMLQNLLEKFEKFYHNSHETNSSILNTTSKNSELPFKS